MHESSQLHHTAEQGVGFKKGFGVEFEKDWKLKLRNGVITTDFTHYSVLADCTVGNLIEGFECRPGKAWVDIKAWALDSDDAIDIITRMGEEVGYKVTGRVEVFETEPEMPPQEESFCYELNFTPFE